MNKYERDASTAIYLYRQSVSGYRTSDLGFDDGADLRLILSAICEKELHETGQTEAHHLKEQAEWAISNKPQNLTHCPVCERKL